MAVGRGNRAIDELPPELRAHIEALIAEGVPATKIYEEWPAVQAVMSLRTLQETAQQIKDDNRYAIYLQNKRMFDRLIAEFGGDAADKSDAERIAYAATIKGMLGGGKTSTQLNGVDAFLEVHKHWRKAEEHKLRMRMQEETLRKIEGAARTDAATGEKIVDLATVARLMREVDLAA